MINRARVTVEAFNDCINRQDLHGLSALMTDGHIFVDTAGGKVSGKEACIKAWASFFSAFPDYRNHFDRIVLVGDKVVVTGRSTCANPKLAGPALWQAKTNGYHLSEWRVFEDTITNRATLGLHD